KNNAMHSDTLLSPSPANTKNGEAARHRAMLLRFTMLAIYELYESSPNRVLGHPSRPEGRG
ncbi:MAG TPA: hypothetical protein VFY89_06970, partial [Ktedonobacterales bacterium]